MELKPDCDDCKELHKPNCEFCELPRLKENCEPCKEKNKPDCEQCYEDLKIPVLMEENLLVYKIYTRVKNQHIMGFNGPVALNLNALYPIMKKAGVRDDEWMRCLDLIQLAYYKARIPKIILDKKQKEELEKNG